MEIGETPQPTTLETALRIATERGAERRQEVAERIRGLFMGIKEKLTRVVDYALGSPDAAAYLGTEAAKFGKEKATEVRDSVVEAGTRAWESIVDTKDRLVQRGIDAKDRLVARYEQTRDATKAKVVDLSKRAAVWGLTKFAVPIERRLEEIWNLPARIREWQAGREEVKAKRYKIRAELAGKVGEAEVEALKNQIASIEKATSRKVDFLNGLRDTALARSVELSGKAVVRRKQARQKFGKARAAVQRLQTR